jgi:hypothetical protein
MHNLVRFPVFRLETYYLENEGEYFEIHRGVDMRSIGENVEVRGHHFSTGTVAKA